MFEKIPVCCHKSAVISFSLGVRACVTHRVLRVFPQRDQQFVGVVPGHERAEHILHTDTQHVHHPCLVSEYNIQMYDPKTYCTQTRNMFIIHVWSLYIIYKCIIQKHTAHKHATLLLPMCYL